MLSIRFRKIPKTALCCYLVGLCILMFCVLAQRYEYWPWSPTRLLQTLILGALIVVTGSVINTLHQFKIKKED